MSRRNRRIPNISMSQPVKSEIAFSDSIQNFTAKLGVGTGSVLSKGNYAGDTTGWLSRSWQIPNNMYRSNWIVHKVIDVLAEDMTKNGIELMSTNNSTEIDELQRELDNLQIQNALANCVRWGNLYGGAIGVLLIEGEDLRTPLNIEAIQPNSFKGIAVFDRWQCMPSYDLVSEYGDEFGLPEAYDIWLLNSPVSNIPGMRPETRYKENGKQSFFERVHHTRVLRFVGHELPYYERIRNLYWGMSVIEPIYDRILIYDTTTYSVANLLLKSYIRHVGVKGMRTAIAAGGKAEQNIQTYLNSLAEMQSLLGIIATDSEDAVTSQNWTFSGADRPLTQFGEQIAGATEIPLVRLFGQPPGGFNSSGEIDMRNYYDSIFAKQNAKLRPAYNKILPVLSMSLLQKPLDDGWAFTFKPLWQPSDMEQAAIAKTDAETVKILTDAGVYDREMGLNHLKKTSRYSNRYGNIQESDYTRIMETVEAVNQEEQPLNTEEKPDESVS